MRTDYVYGVRVKSQVVRYDSQQTAEKIAAVRQGAEVVKAPLIWEKVRK